jgi:hypothetical protein
MKITDEHLEGAELVQDIAQDTIAFTKSVLSARGMDQSVSVAGTLIAAAWLHHVSLAPHHPEVFADLLRETADSIDRVSRLH